MSIGSGIGELGAAVGSLFAASGAREAASMYDKAADIAFSNKRIEEGSLILQVAQAQRKYDLATGSRGAQLSAAGFTGNQDLDFEGKEQFGLNKQAITTNNIIQQNTYQAQGEADQSMAKQERIKAEANTWASGFQAIAGIVDIGVGVAAM